MKNLWFKARFVEPILRAEKTDTYRRSIRIRPGEIVGLSVGPRRPFVTARIVDIETIICSELCSAKATELRAIYGNLPKIFYRVSFVKIDT